MKSLFALAWVALLCGCATTAMKPGMPAQEDKKTAATEHHLFRDMTVAEKYSALKAAAEELAGSRSDLNFSFMPGFAEHLKNGIRISGEFWSESTNFDEFAKNQILPEKVVQKLGIPNRKEGDLQITSAGVMHTYGYLFSTLMTPYGLKAKRWLESKLDQRLGFSPGLLSPDPSSGEFLANLTWILERVTMQNRDCNAITGVSPELCKLERTHPNIHSLGYLEQEVKIAPRAKSILLRTHFIPLLPAQGASETHLLAYELIEGKKRKWITAFPIKEDFLKQLILGQILEPQTDLPFKARYNLYLKSGSGSIQKSLGFIRAR